MQAEYMEGLSVFLLQMSSKILLLIHKTFTNSHHIAAAIKNYKFINNSIVVLGTNVGK